MFFQNVLDHWFVSLIWLVLSVRIVHRLLNHVKEYRWYRRLFCPVHYWPTALRILLSLGVHIVTLGFILATLPVTWVWIVRKEKDERKRREEENRERDERARVAEERRKEENVRRNEARKQWFSENRPRLYYNTVNGITAVLRPDVYEAIQKQTATNRRNGFWEKDNILCPAQETIVFVTKQGKELVAKSLESSHSAGYKVAGWLSQLDEIVEWGNAELIRDEQIFVPWVNETVVPFSEQRHIIQDCHGGATYKLIESQAPRELQPL